METKDFNIDSLKGRNPFKVPEGYMEGLADRIMSQLPEKAPKEEKVVSMYDRVRPWLYLAAIFVGLIFLFKSVTTLNIQSDKSVVDPLYVQTGVPDAAYSAISEEDQEYLEYLEDQYADELLMEEITNAE